jgi:outer membrane receptor protein involved in Fe transport
MLFKDKSQTKHGVSRDVMMVAAALTTTFVGVGAGSAQEASSDELVITGSRAARAGYVAPTPTSVIRSDVIDRQAATGVGQVLVQNPAFRATRSPQANANNLSSPGQFTADLRGLGGQRTLVLVDDARVVPYAAASNNGSPNAVDLNLLPTMMIDRVETVTGGASAQYGSDAVAGVVNIFMKKQYDGFRVRAQTGQTDLGDNKGYKVGFVGGTNLFEDKGHFVVGGEWEKSDGVRSFSSRDWGRKNWMQVTNGQRTTPNTAGFGLPALLVSDNVVQALGSGGRITSGALNGQAFNPDGTTHTFQAGIAATATGSTLQLGGEGGSILQGSSMIPDLDRYSIMARYGYDFTDTTKGYIQVGYADSKSTLFAAQLRRTADTIHRDNAFLPTPVRLAYAGTPTFTFSRLYNDMGNGRFDIENKSPRVTIGMEGAIGTSGWDWDAHYSWGKNEYLQTGSNNAVAANYGFAEDAVLDTATGNIVCRATLAAGAPGTTRPDGTTISAANRAAAAGCVPLNPFGEGKPSAAAIAYINQTGWLGADYVQHDAAINLKGEPLSTWAGKVSVATGLEYREETEVVTASSLAGTNAFANAGNGAPWSGGFHVTEGYVETIVPLARDMPFAKLLDLNAAYRYADYSLAGGQSAWKAGLVYEPVEWLRFRATQSRDVRAPAPNELFSPGTPVTNAATVNGIQQTIFQNLTLGNPNLNPEKADTRTIGFVVKPDEGPLAGLRMSVDYYQIKLKGAITNLVTGDARPETRSSASSFRRSRSRRRRDWLSRRSISVHAELRASIFRSTTKSRSIISSSRPISAAATRSNRLSIRVSAAPTAGSTARAKTPRTDKVRCRLSVAICRKR